MTYFTDADRQELTSLWHTARIAGTVSRYDRLQYVTRQYCKTHSEVPSLPVYKEIDNLTRGYGHN
jgi:hypothetical protein